MKQVPRASNPRASLAHNFTRKTNYQAKRSHGPGEKLIDRTAPVWRGNVEDLSDSMTAASASRSSRIKAVSKIVMIPFCEATAQISTRIFESALLFKAVLPSRRRDHKTKGHLACQISLWVKFGYET